MPGAAGRRPVHALRALETRRDGLGAGLAVVARDGGGAGV
jgi:hypothetical protein